MRLIDIDTKIIIFWFVLSLICSINKLVTIPVNGEVETHQLCELRVVEAKHAAVVGRQILVFIDGTDALAVTVGVTEDGRSHHGQLGDQVHRVLICELVQKTYIVFNLPSTIITFPHGGQKSIL